MALFVICTFLALAVALGVIYALRAPLQVLSNARKARQGTQTGRVETVATEGEDLLTGLRSQIKELSETIYLARNATKLLREMLNAERVASQALCAQYNATFHSLEALCVELNAERVDYMEIVVRSFGRARVEQILARRARADQERAPGERPLARQDDETKPDGFRTTPRGQRAAHAPPERAGNAGPTVTELKPRWLKLRREARVNGQAEYKPSTIAAYEWHLEVIEETFDETFKGEMPLGKFDDQQARAWVKTLKATTAPNTCGNVYSTLRSLIEDAIAERWVLLPANPLALDAVKRELPARKPLTGKRPIFVEIEHMQTLVGCSEVPQHRRVRYLVDVCTGLSEGELAGRIWSDAVLTDKPTLNVADACAIHGEHGWATQSTTKNEHRVRTIPLHSAAAEALLWWWHEGWAQYVGRPPKMTDPIFPGPSGEFSRPASAALLRKDLLAAGCSSTRYGHNITAQALRRCFATYLDAMDVPEEQRGRLLGHAKKTVTAKHYTNEQIETDRRAVERIALRWVPPERLVAGLVPRLVALTPKPFVLRAAFET